MYFPVKRLYVYPLSDGVSLTLNGATGAVDLMEKDTLRLLTNGPLDETSIPQEILPHLLERGYIYRTPTEEDEKYVAMCNDFFNSLQANSPIQYMICPTLDCNLTCTYCYEANWMNKEDMPTEYIPFVFRAIDELAAQHATRPRVVTLFGGEPLLPRVKKQVFQISEMTRARQMRLAVISNGVCIRAAYSDWVKDYRSIIDYVQITIDGPEDVHDKRRHAKGAATYRSIVDSVDFLLTQKIPVRLRVNIDAGNVDHIASLVEYVKMQGWTESECFTCDLAPVTDHGLQGLPNLLDEREMFDAVVARFPLFPSEGDVFRLRTFRVLNRLLSALKPAIYPEDDPQVVYCEACAGSFMVFTPNGNIYPCAEGMYDLPPVGTFYPEFSLVSDANKWCRRTVLDIEPCRDCKIALFCGGGCAYAAWKLLGDIRKAACSGTAESLITALLESKTQDFLDLYELLKGS